MREEKSLVKDRKTGPTVPITGGLGAAGFGAALFFAALFTGCAGGPPEGLGPLDLVGEVDVERYLGRWYEIARFQHRFEKNIVGATAEYSLREDGKIRVVNSGYKGSLDGKYTEVEAVAWVPDPDRPGELKVRFFSLFTSDYLIFGLDQENYEWALVGNNSRKFLWFLAREHEIKDDLLEKMKGIARRQGYDLEGLYLVPQKPRE
ncbi:MAG: lipocalin family protein [Spirochaetota bacterium]